MHEKCNLSKNFKVISYFDVGSDELAIVLYTIIKYE